MTGSHRWSEFQYEGHIEILQERWREMELPITFWYDEGDGAGHFICRLRQCGGVAWGSVSRCSLGFDDILISFSKRSESWRTIVHPIAESAQPGTAPCDSADASHRAFRSPSPLSP